MHPITRVDNALSVVAHINDLEFSNAYLTCTEAAVIANAPQCISMQTLRLQDNRIKAKGLLVLLTSLQELTHLNMASNKLHQLRNYQTWVQIGQAMTTRTLNDTDLQWIDISNNLINCTAIRAISAGVVCLKACNTRAQEHEIVNDQNGLHLVQYDRHGTTLNDILVLSTRMCKLDLKGCELNAAGASSVIKCATVMPGLQYLGLAKNDITDSRFMHWQMSLGDVTPVVLLPLLTGKARSEYSVEMITRFVDSIPIDLPFNPLDYQGEWPCVQLELDTATSECITNICDALRTTMQPDTSAFGIKHMHEDALIHRCWQRARIRNAGVQLMPCFVSNFRHQVALRIFYLQTIGSAEPLITALSLTCNVSAPTPVTKSSPCPVIDLSSTELTDLMQMHLTDLMDPSQLRFSCADYPPAVFTWEDLDDSTVAQLHGGSMASALCVAQRISKLRVLIPSSWSHLKALDLGGRNLKLSQVFVLRETLPICEQLETLGLAGNLLCSTCMDILAEMIATQQRLRMPQLTCLDLNENRPELAHGRTLEEVKRSIKKLFDAIALSNITTLQLMGCSLSYDTFHRLCKVVADPTTLIQSAVAPMTEKLDLPLPTRYYTSFRYNARDMKLIHQHLHNSNTTSFSCKDAYVSVLMPTISPATCNLHTVNVSNGKLDALEMYRLLEAVLSKPKVTDMNISHNPFGESDHFQMAELCKVLAHLMQNQLKVLHMQHGSCQERTKDATQDVIGSWRRLQSLHRNQEFAYLLALEIGNAANQACTASQMQVLRTGGSCWGVKGAARMSLATFLYMPLITSLSMENEETNSTHKSDVTALLGIVCPSVGCVIGSALITELTLTGIGLQTHSAMALGSALTRSPKKFLRKLDLSQNNKLFQTDPDTITEAEYQVIKGRQPNTMFTSGMTAMCIAQAISVHPTLIEVVIEDTGLTSFELDILMRRLISNASNHDLQRLVVGENGRTLSHVDTTDESYAFGMMSIALGDKFLALMDLLPSLSSFHATYRPTTLDIAHPRWPRDHRVIAKEVARSEVHELVIETGAVVSMTREATSSAVRTQVYNNAITDQAHNSRASATSISKSDSTIEIRNGVYDVVTARAVQSFILRMDNLSVITLKGNNGRLITVNAFQTRWDLRNKLTTPTAAIIEAFVAFRPVQVQEMVLGGEEDSHGHLWSNIVRQPEHAPHFLTIQALDPQVLVRAKINAPDRECKRSREESKGLTSLGRGASWIALSYLAKIPGARDAPLGCSMQEGMQLHPTLFAMARKYLRSGDLGRCLPLTCGD
jgi:Ran GTPase-activating protein (RanGAP) involved in mRNA processing and transport